MRFMIEEKDEGKLLRAYLKEQGVSAALCARLKNREDGLVLDGKRVTVRAVLHTGSVLDLGIEEREPPVHVLPRDLPLTVLAEDEDLLVLNKAAGMPTHPSHGHFEDTLANALAFRYAKDNVPFRPRFINRLDRNTTGAVLVARHALAAGRLSAKMAAGEIQKTYLALVRGRVDAPCVIESGIRRKEASVILRIACPIGEGDRAESELIPLAWCDAFSLVRLIPRTGRTHQLRVHMAHIGHPLLGDELYGDGLGMGRHALHAATLTFPTLRGEGTVTVRAPLPADMWEKIRTLGEEAMRLAKEECGETG